MTKNWPGRFYLMLRSKHTMPGDRPIIDIDHKYNSQKVLYFVATEGAGSTNMVFPIYLMTLTSFSISPFDLLLVPRSCLSSLDMSMKWTPTKNPDSQVSVEKALGYSV